MASEAPICRAALTQANARWPNRAKSSDGVLSSQAHRKQNPSSDHDFGNATDLTHDPTDGPDCSVEAARLADLASKGQAPWIKYLIFNRRIWSAARSKEGWRPYNGDNPHERHMHVSVNAAYRHADIDWWDRPTVVRREDEMSPAQEKKLDRVIDLLEALVAPRDAAKHDKDKTKISLGDVLTVVEKETR